MTKTYTEAQLQAYVEAYLERDFRDWCDIFGAYPPRGDVRLIGSQVPCVSGIIDILATVKNTPMVIELKAVPVTERVIGQVMRYRSAVSDAFSTRCWDIRGETGLDFDFCYGEDQVLCVIIAPDYDRASMNSITHLGWPLVATMQDDGRFDIRSAWRKRARRIGYESPTVSDLLDGTARQLLGANIGRAWGKTYRQESTKQYSVSEA